MFRKNHIKSTTQVDSHLYCQQYAYKKGRSVKDATLYYVNFVAKHLDDNICAISVFIDFSSAFNTIIPHILVKR